MASYPDIACRHRSIPPYPTAFLSNLVDRLCEIAGQVPTVNSSLHGDESSSRDVHVCIS